MDNYGLISLSRLNIVGLLTEKTPNCVICQVASSFGYTVDLETTNLAYVDKIIKTINTSVVQMVNRTNPDPMEAGLIRRFINVDTSVKWNLSSLKQAFEHLIMYYSGNTIPPPESDFIAGFKTPDNPTAYDPCILYAICQANRINTNFFTTFEQLSTAVRLLCISTTTIRSRIIGAIADLSREALISLAMGIQTGETQSFPSDEEITIACRGVFNPITLIQKLTPKNHAEAIAYGAIQYGINLSECNNPLLEYMECQQANLEERDYTPLNPIFRRRFQVNPHWYNVRSTWSPKLSSIYTFGELRIMTANEGCRNLYQQPEQFLRENRIISTFYSGVHPCLITSPTNEIMTVIGRDNPFDYSHDFIISYGIVEENNFVVYTTEELTEYFKQSGILTDPQNPQEMLSTRAISKLKKICHSHPCHDPLFDIIKEIEQKESIDPRGRLLQRMYSSHKESIDRFLELILESALYMRGWKVAKEYPEKCGIEEYPLSSEQTIVPLDIYEQVTVNVTEAINNIEIFIEGVDDEIKDLLINLSLIRRIISGNSFLFSPSTSSEIGFTLMDKIALCKNGTACIRAASNYLLASNYYYNHIVLSNPKPFLIESVKDVF